MERSWRTTTGGAVGSGANGAAGDGSVNGASGVAGRGGDGRRSFVRTLHMLLARPLVVVLALITLVQTSQGALGFARQGVQIIRDPNAAPGSNTKHQWDKVRREMAEQIPPGSKIYCCGTAPAAEGWEHRIIAFALINDSVVVPDRADADVEVSIVRDTTARTGIRLVVRPLR